MTLICLRDIDVVAFTLIINSSTEIRYSSLTDGVLIEYFKSNVRKNVYFFQYCCFYIHLLAKFYILVYVILSIYNWSHVLLVY